MANQTLPSTSREVSLLDAFKDSDQKAALRQLLADIISIRNSVDGLVTYVNAHIPRNSAYFGNIDSSKYLAVVEIITPVQDETVTIGDVTFTCGAAESLGTGVFTDDGGSANGAAQSLRDCIYSSALTGIVLAFKVNAWVVLMADDASHALSTSDPDNFVIRDWVSPTQPVPPTVKSTE